MDTIPAALTSFVGRQRELSEARKLLSSSRLLTLTGMGGIGKTRLALQLAASVRRVYPGGVWVVELAELTDPALLAQTVTAAVGLRDGAAASTARLAAYLADKQVLLVLDNCEHMPDACAALLSKVLAAAPQVKALATSRHRLGVEGEQLMPVPPLPVPDSPDDCESDAAVTLFADRAAAAAPGFAVTLENTDAVFRICRRLEGMPLAIELAAVWLRTLSLEQILARLDDRFALLTRGPRTGPPRQQTLQATIDWSFDLCSPLERSMWAWLSVFSDSFDLDAAEDVCSGPDIPRHEVLDLIAGLVDKSILTRYEHGRGSRYHMLDTIQSYGRARLAESGEELTCRKRHRDYFRRLAVRFEAECFGPNQLDWLLLMRREHLNLRTALEFCLVEPADASTMLEIAGPTYHWITSGYLREGVIWLDRALALDNEPTAARAKALWVRSFLAILLGETEAVGWMLGECHILAKQLDKANTLFPNIWQCEGLAASNRGDLAEARVKFEQALAGHLTTGCWHCAFDCMFQLGMIAMRCDDPAAGELSKRCLAFCEEHQAQWSKGRALWLLGLHSWREGDPKRGIRFVQDSIVLLQPVDDLSGFAICFEALAWCEASDKRWERAARLFGIADDVWQRTGASVSAAVHRFAHDEVEARVRARLGTEAFDRAYQQGAGYSLSRAMAFALELKARSPDGARGRARAVDVLSRRETEIAELVAKGMSNKEIGASLLISQRTAESHVEHILAKLGFTSRAQIAAWVAVHSAADQP
jgi:predicted ATPase/DNA-binding CsgD family transcriptional regulator